MAKTSTKKAADELAELEELEGLEDIEADEPDEIDETEVAEDPKPKRSRSKKTAAKADEAEADDEKPATLKELRAQARELKIAGVSKLSRDELVAAIAAGGTADEADDEVDDEEPAEKEETLKSIRARAAALKIPGARKLNREDALAAIEKAGEADDEEDDEEDDEPVKETAAAKKKRLAAEKKAAAAKGKSAEAKPKAEKTGVGTAEIAEEAGVDGRKVRIFLRNNSDDFPKPDGHRYNWPSLVNKDAKRLIKALQKAYPEG